jgi:hypothetical protein
MMKTSPARPPRNRVDLSTKDMTRLWCKHFRKTKGQIEAAISKVGNNAATVSKELGDLSPNQCSDSAVLRGLDA